MVGTAGAAGEGEDREGAPPWRRAEPVLHALWPWLVGGALAAALVWVAVVLMREAALFDTTADETGVKRLAAALALAGTVLSAALTLLGTVVKFSIDHRNTRLAELEFRSAELRHAEAKLRALEAERRERIEVILKAAELMGKQEGAAADRQAAGAILALSSLGEHDLAIALLRQVWGGQARFGSVAYIVTRRVLGRDAGPGIGDETKIAAAALLNFKADRIEQGTSHIWPLLEDGWRVEGLPENARFGLVMAAVGWFVQALGAGPGIPDAVFVLYRALDDPKREIAGVAAAALGPFLEAYGDAGVVVYSIDFTGSVPIAEIVRRAAAVDGASAFSEIGDRAARAVAAHQALQPGQGAPATQLDMQARPD